MKRKRVTEPEFHSFVQKLITPGSCIEVTHADGRVEYLTLAEYMKARAQGLESTRVEVYAHKSEHERIRA